MDQIRSVSPRSITSSGLSPSKASLGVWSHFPTESSFITSLRASLSRASSVTLRATGSVGVLPLSKLARDRTEMERAQKRCLEPYISPKVPDTFFDIDAALAGALTAIVTALLQTLLEMNIPGDRAHFRTRVGQARWCTSWQ